VVRAFKFRAGAASHPLGSKRVTCFRMSRVRRSAAEPIPPSRRSANGRHNQASRLPILGINATCVGVTDFSGRIILRFPRPGRRRTRSQMRYLLACLFLLAACGPKPAAADGKASAFRINFEASMLAACKRELTAIGVPQAEIEFACPCMTKEVLANAPTDADLVAHTDALRGKAVKKCVALAEERFPRP
jgi:hypothetical protein